MKNVAEKIQRVTVHLPKNLLSKAQKITHAGITDTIRLALENLAIAKACDDLKSVKGKVKFSIDINKLREE